MKKVEKKSKRAVEPVIEGFVDYAVIIKDLQEQLAEAEEWRATWRKEAFETLDLLEESLKAIAFLREENEALKRSTWTKLKDWFKIIRFFILMKFTAPD